MDVFRSDEDGRLTRAPVREKARTCPGPHRRGQGANSENRVGDDFDIFLSAKSLDEEGNRTPDSLLAERLHEHLTAEGFRVFLSNISLEQLGVAGYKRAIDDALDRAKVLVAVGTSRAHLESQWVRYEWDSFFNDILSDVKPEGRVFTYVCGMRPRDLPRALRQRTCIEDGPDAFQRLSRFIANALGREMLPGDDASHAAGEGGPTVAIVGSMAGQCGDWSSFCRRLGESVAAKGYRVLATNARGVGRAYYLGACELLTATAPRDVPARCHLMRLGSSDPEKRRAVRQAFLGGADACFVVGGGRGTREEYEILEARGALVIPVGASGGTAREIWIEIREDRQGRLEPRIAQAFALLGDRGCTEDDLLEHATTVLEGVVPCAESTSQRPGRGTAPVRSRAVGLDGEWMGHWRRSSGKIDHEGRMCVRRHGDALAATMTVSFLKNGVRSVGREVLSGVADGRDVVLHGDSFTYVEQGRSTSYSLDNFELRLDDSGRALVGDFYSKKGRGSARFERIG